MHTKEEIRADRREKAFNESFSKWMSEPTTRLGLSMIPPSENSDAVKLLLRSAFNAGTSVGIGLTTGEFIETIFDGMSKRKEEGRDTH